MTELEEHLLVVQWLNAKGVYFHHSPNEAKRSVQQWAMLKRLGMVSGWPDFTIPGNPSIGLELKKAKVPSVRGGSFKGTMTGGGKVSPEQTECLRRLSELGWTTYVAYGASEAISWLEKQPLVCKPMKRINVI